MRNSQDLRGINSVHPRVSNQPDEVMFKRNIESQPGHENSDSDTTGQEKQPTDPNIVDWDGPEDPANPMNWSSVRKIGAIAMVSTITMLS